MYKKKSNKLNKVLKTPCLNIEEDLGLIKLVHSYCVVLSTKKKL